MPRPRLNRDEMLRLIQRAQANEPGALDAAARANDGLVGRQVSPYLPHCTHLEAEDLMQSGRIGLVKAIRDYDPTRGKAWATCASTYIRNEIRRTMTNEEHTIRIPSHVWDKRRSGDKREFPGCLRSLDDPMGIGREEGPGDPLADWLPAPDNTEAEALGNIANAELRAAVLAALEHTPERARDAAVRYFGLTGENPQSLQEIADAHGCSRECARHHVHLSIRRIREHYRALGYTIDIDTVELTPL